MGSLLRGLFFMLCNVWAIYGQNVSFVGQSTYNGIPSSKNLWTTNLPNLTVEYVSNDFTVLASGFFSIVYSNIMGTEISSCQYRVTTTACQENCVDTDNIFSCVYTTKLTIVMTIVGVTEDKDQSFISLLQSESGPVTRDNWIYNNVTIIVRNCTKDSDGIDDKSTELEDASASCDYKCKALLSCKKGFLNSSSLEATCEANSAWKPNATCDAETTTPMPVTTASTANSTSETITTMPSDTTAETNSSKSTVDGQKPGIAFSVISPASITGAAVIAHPVTKHKVTTPVIVIYVASGAFCLSGILMCFLGTADGIVIGGIVLACVGTLGVTLGMALWLYFKGEKNKG